MTAVNGNDQEAASEAIANCDIMATAVGARILKFIVGNIVAGLRKRWARDDRPLNIIICENLMDANKVMEGMLKDLLTDEEKKHFDEKVGLVEASIVRMVPVQTEEMKDGDPMRVCVERYGFLPVDKAAFKGEIPEITNMVPFEPFDFYIKRKLYVHNMGHATCAYLGGYEGRKYIYQSIDDPEILNIVQNAMLESALALHKKYGVELDGPDAAHHGSSRPLPQCRPEGHLQARRRRPDAEARRSRPADRFEPAVPRAGREARVYRRRRSRCGVPLSERGGH